MSFLKSLFGRKDAKPAAPAGPLKSTEYKGFTIHATPFAEGGQQHVDQQPLQAAPGARAETGARDDRSGLRRSRVARHRLPRGV